MICVWQIDSTDFTQKTQKIFSVVHVVLNAGSAGNGVERLAQRSR